jgi:hypothetical protein
MLRIVLVIPFFFTLNSYGQTFEAFMNEINARSGCHSPGKTEKYTWFDGFCNSTIWLNNDSTFYISGGCENHSYISSGKWIQTGDSIQLLSLSATNYKLYCQVSGSGGQAKNNVTVQVLERKGKPVEGSGYCITTIRKRATEIYYPDTLGRIVIPLKGVDSLRFQNIADQKANSTILAKHLPATIHLYLNVNEYVPFFEYMGADLKYFYASTGWSFKRTSNELIDKYQVWNKE